MSRRAQQDVICRDIAGIKRLVKFGSDIPRSWSVVGPADDGPSLAEGAELTAGAAMQRVHDTHATASPSADEGNGGELEALRDEHEQLKALAAGEIARLAEQLERARADAEKNDTGAQAEIDELRTKATAATAERDDLAQRLQAAASDDPAAEAEPPKKPGGRSAKSGT